MYGIRLFFVTKEVQGRTELLASNWPWTLSGARALEADPLYDIAAQILANKRSPRSEKTEQVFAML